MPSRNKGYRYSSLGLRPGRNRGYLNSNLDLCQADIDDIRIPVLIFSK